MNLVAKIFQADKEGRKSLAREIVTRITSNGDSKVVSILGFDVLHLSQQNSQVKPKNW
jgi:hypothetical protein